MSDIVIFCLILVFALLGIADMIRRLALQVLRPEQTLATFSLAYLRRDTENAEQIIRYFRARAGREDVLLLVDNGVKEEEKAVIRKLCENRRDIRWISEENFIGENCNYTADEI